MKLKSLAFFSLTLIAGTVSAQTVL
ncbi:MAG: hypothetical protein RL535_1583, partial [Pseudomonadota bacterium]